MFKKIELWILLLISIFFLLFGLLFGVLVRQELEGSNKLGLISKYALEIARIPANIKWLLSDNRHKAINPYSVSVIDSNKEEEKITLNKELSTNHLYVLNRYDKKSKKQIVELRELKNLELLHTYNIEVGGGLGPFSGKVWRIGSMGYSAYEKNVDQLLDALKKLL